MTDIQNISLIAAFIALASSFLGLFLFVRNNRIRDTLYIVEKHRADLDKTREAFENEISKLHDQIYRDEGRFKELNHLLLDVVEKQKGELPAKQQTDTPSGFLSQMGVDEKIAVEDRLVFVLTPFTKSEQGTYDAIRNVCQNLGLQTRRGDEKQIIGPIFPHILGEIKRAWLIIANLNGRNPNVFYELGIAQSLGKPCLIVGKSEDSLPFDLSHQQVVLYSNRDELRLRLTEAVSRAALGQQLQSPMRSYAREAVPQEALIRLANPSQIPEAMKLLLSHEDIDRVYPIEEASTLMVNGMSKSRQFISDLQDFLNNHGIPSRMATLLSGSELLK